MGKMMSASEKKKKRGSIKVFKSEMNMERVESND